MVINPYCGQALTMIVLLSWSALEMCEMIKSFHTFLCTPRSVNLFEPQVTLTVPFSLASPQTSFGVRLSRIHAWGEMNA